MATALTDGKLYLIESDDTDNQDWIADNSGDPDAIDLDSFTIGTEFCVLDFVFKFDKRGVTGAVVPPSPGGAITTDEKESARFYIVTVSAKASSKAQADQFDKFCMANRHVSGVPTTFKRYHMILYWTTNVHELFTDGGVSGGVIKENRVSYLTGIVSPDFIISLDEKEPLIRNVNFVFKSVWG